MSQLPTRKGGGNEEPIPGEQSVCRNRRSCPVLYAFRNSNLTNPLVSQQFPNSLSTRRLLLRRLQQTDAQALCSYRSLPEVAAYQSWESFGPDDAARLLDDQADREIAVPGTWFQIAMIDSVTGEMIGDCGVHCLADEPQQFELGVTLSPSRQGQGLATEALACVLHYLFATLGARRVFATTDVLNAPAAALFRRLGFRQEAHHIERWPYKGTWTSEYVFALLAREWRDFPQLPQKL